jgi:predicted amino acid dehydrogenase
MQGTAKFGFIVHPIEARRDVARKYPMAKWAPIGMIEWFLRRKSPILMGHATGIISETGREAEGWFVGCPLTPKMMLELPQEFVYRRIADACEVAFSLGAEIVGLGAFTSVVGDGGITIQRLLGRPITTGNSYTVATAIEGGLRAARLMEIDLTAGTVCIVGASGSIGRTCAQAFAEEAARMILVGRETERLRPLAEVLRAKSGKEIICSADVAGSVMQSDLVVTVTSSADAIISAEDIKPGAVVVDVARPRDVSVEVARKRDDCLVIEGGLVQVPGNPDFGFNFGFPSGTAYACMSETMLLALEGRCESFTLGKDVSLEQVEETQRMAARHGFRLAGFRSFERAVSEETIARVRENARRNRAVEMRQRWQSKSAS